MTARPRAPPPAIALPRASAARKPFVGDPGTQSWTLTHADTSVPVGKVSVCDLACGGHFTHAPKLSCMSATLNKVVRKNSLKGTNAPPCSEASSFMQPRGGQSSQRPEAMATSEACDAHCSLSVDSAAAGRHFLVSVCLCLVPAPPYYRSPGISLPGNVSVPFPALRHPTGCRLTLTRRALVTRPPGCCASTAATAVPRRRGPDMGSMIEGRAISL